MLIETVYEVRGCPHCAIKGDINIIPCCHNYRDSILYLFDLLKKDMNNTQIISGSVIVIYVNVLQKSGVPGYNNMILFNCDSG